MFYSKVFLVLLCCPAFGHAIDCANATICVAGEGECQHHYTHIVHNLSDIVLLNVLSCKTAHIYLMSGTHFLNVNLDFNDSVKETGIHGTQRGHPSIIQCEEKAGVRFSEDINASVFMSHLTFTGCNRMRKFRRYDKPATLYFRNVLYTLKNVTVTNTSGYGLITFKCREQMIANSLFKDNSEGHVWILFTYYDMSVRISHVSVIVSKTHFSSSSTGIGIRVDIYKRFHCKVNISNCTFNGPGSHVLIKAKSNKEAVTSAITIEYSTFTKGSGTYGVNLQSEGLLSKMNVSVQNSCFIDNDNGALQITGANRVEIGSCEFSINGHGGTDLTTNVRFSDIDSLTIENSIFKGNRGSYHNCSCLTINEANMVLDDVVFTDNNCTGIILHASSLTVRNLLNITRNSGTMGGALRMSRKEIISNNNLTKIFSNITLGVNAKLDISNNTGLYGGGIYTDETCESRGLKRSCFFQFEEIQTVYEPGISFSLNKADLGGDAIFGGCLSDCLIYTHGRTELVTITEPHSIVFKLISLDELLTSTFAEYPTQVVFCSLETSLISEYNANCSSKHTLRAYRGEQFNISLMVADDFCTSSVGFIQAKIKEDGAELGDLCGGESYKKSNKYCDNYFYSVKADLALKLVTLEMFIHQVEPSISAPAVLTVFLEDCPIGFKFDSTDRECVCNDLLNSRGIKCKASTHSLEVPAFTWIGIINGQAAVNEYCQYCHIERYVTIEMLENSDKLCSQNRTGILCGECIAKNSIQLGRFQCATCSHSNYKGVLLVLGFMVIGIAMVLLLLSLNLTVSTGLISGLVFYSNIVHLNSDVFLPIDNKLNTLNNVISVLSAFQAWMNLDFGITTCFFDGYDAYISTWMQFVFPLYIWLLILIIVLASRYSKKISKITTSNTVSVLATLLLLSYAKLLKTSIDAASFTTAEFLNDSSKHRVWILDGNIQYLQGKHIPLLLMSLVTIVIYVLPFTLLILLGPLLQAKSHYRFLNWINKLKPFLDAFYGPYTNKYRYWPGILLLARVIILGIFGFYSLGDSPFKLVTESVVVAVLLLAWMLIGKTQNTSLYLHKYLNYLELFFLLNLGVFSIASTYVTTKFTVRRIEHQQGLAVVMVGSVLATLSGILSYQVFRSISRCKAMHKIVQFIRAIVPTKRKDNAKGGGISRNRTQNTDSEGTSTKTTHSLVEISESTLSNDELREPLLTNT